ncbi:class I SAM-dependent methyltransferase [Pseudomonas typographi]|uniref:Class I SAM-dependent methyltransferase n=1 Tax=Pseudomonas typographi TaxID=2715964 RepID=A0ABR7Z7S2_9PSED|nr:class I SAM-dependent methyltransferase [Pseudomonas typographi]MBD1601359.1 class I SAM-dependent methyltransferase [Pseudomonas typographi]
MTILDSPSQPGDSAGFYASGSGDRLFSDDHFPPAISAFLQSERALLAAAARHKHAIVEIGCHEGTHAEWCRAAGKHYLGVDPVERYIRQGLAKQPDFGERECKLVVGSAEQIDEIIVRELDGILPSDILIFIPFNCFGNITAVESAVGSIARSGCSLLLSAYQTSLPALLARFSYYAACGYNPLTLSRSERGELFHDNNGLHTYAYAAAWLSALFSRFAMTVTPIRHGGIGQAYVTPDLEGGVTGILDSAGADLDNP